MSIKLYHYPRAPWATSRPIKVDKSNGCVGDEYLSKFPTGKVPALERDGYTVYGCIAVSIYLAKQNPSTKLLGKTLEEEATVIQWSSFENSELLPSIMAWINPVVEKAPSSPEILAAAEKASGTMIVVLEKALQGRKYLVGDGLTMADLFAISALARGYQFVFARGWTEKHAALHDYCWKIRSDAIWTKIDGDAYVLDVVGEKPL